MANGNALKSLERVMGLEPTTSSLGSSCTGTKMYRFPRKRCDPRERTMLSVRAERRTNWHICWHIHDGLHCAR